MSAHSMKSMAIPTLTAVVALAMVIGMNSPSSTMVMSAHDAGMPTPYSADHARVQNDPNASQDQPATF
jgi:hypothetical protein